MSENFNIGHNFWPVWDKDCIFGMHIQLMKPYQLTSGALVPLTMTFILKISNFVFFAARGICVSQTHLIFSFKLAFCMALQKVIIVIVIVVHVVFFIIVMADYKICSFLLFLFEPIYILSFFYISDHKNYHFLWYCPLYVVLAMQA